MRKIILYIIGALYVLFWFTACKENNAEQTIILAEKYLESNQRDSACHILQSLEQPLRLSDEMNARYALVQTQAFILTGDWIKSDSLINIAVEYYKNALDSTYYTKSLYWAGMVNIPLENFEKADSLFELAAQACPSDDYEMLFYIYRQKGFANLYRGEPKKVLEAFRKEAECGKLSQIKDKEFIYLLDLALAYRINNQADSSLFYYYNLLEKSKQEEETWKINTLYGEISDTYLYQKNYKKGLEYALLAKETRNSRWELPVYNLAIGQIYMHSNQADSARHYLLKAVQSTNPYVSTVGYDYLVQLDKTLEKYESAYQNFRKHQESVVLVKSNINSDILKQQYREEKLKNENNQLKISQQEQELYFLVLCILCLLAFTGIYIYYTLNKKKRAAEERKREEERLQEKAYQLERENLLLKQQQELSLLREKAAELRESLFRKLPFIHKIPSLDKKKEDADFQSFDRKITLTEEDWDELIQTVNQAYGDFVTRLQQQYPLLNKNDITFCCLLKIKVTMKDLSDIYCISKAGITKKKTRLKNEKLGLQAEDVTLDEFLQSF